MPSVQKDLVNKIEKAYLDKDNWQPPSYAWLAKKLGVGKTTIHYALKISGTLKRKP